MKVEVLASYRREVDSMRALAASSHADVAKSLVRFQLFLPFGWIPSIEAVFEFRLVC